MNHENIILMFDYFETDREFCVVTEYAQVRWNSANLWECLSFRHTR